MGMLAHYLACINLFLRENEEFAAVLQLVNGIGKSRTGLHGNHRTVGTPFNLTLIRLIFLKTVCHDSLAGRSGQHIGTQTDDTARRHVELKIYTFAGTFHLHHFTFTTGHHINHLAGIFFGNIDGKLFNRFAFHAVNLLEDYLRLPYLQLIPFTTHGLNQYGKMKHATAGNNPLAVFLALAHAKCKILIQLLHQTVVDVAGSNKLTFLTEERRVINGEEHTHRRFINGNRRQRFRIFVIADRISDFESFDTYQRTDVTGRHFLHLYTAHTFECMQFLDF